MSNVVDLSNYRRARPQVEPKAGNIGSLLAVGAIALVAFWIVRGLS